MREINRKKTHHWMFSCQSIKTMLHSHFLPQNVVVQFVSFCFCLRLLFSSLCIPLISVLAFCFFIVWMLCRSWTSVLCFIGFLFHQLVNHNSGGIPFFLADYLFNIAGGKVSHRVVDKNENKRKNGEKEDKAHPHWRFLSCVLIFKNKQQRKLKSGLFWCHAMVFPPPPTRPG